MNVVWPSVIGDKDKVILVFNFFSSLACQNSLDIVLSPSFKIIYLQNQVWTSGHYHITRLVALVFTRFLSHVNFLALFLQSLYVNYRYFTYVRLYLKFHVTSLFLLSFQVKSNQKRHAINSSANPFLHSYPLLLFIEHQTYRSVVVWGIVPNVGSDDIMTPFI